MDRYKQLSIEYIGLNIKIRKTLHTQNNKFVLVEQESGHYEVLEYKYAEFDKDNKITLNYIESIDA